MKKTEQLMEKRGGGTSATEVWSASLRGGLLADRTGRAQPLHTVETRAEAEALPAGQGHRVRGARRIPDRREQADAGC